VRDKLDALQSLAAIGRECGLSKDWIFRHLHSLDADAAKLASTSRQKARDARWLAGSLSFGDVASYLRQRHLIEHASVNAIAREVGVSFHAARSALQRHEITMPHHAATRHRSGVAVQNRHRDMRLGRVARSSAGLLSS